jgi:DMSO/TMAO reductase YedYZ molybdopterin-dependent catalytic subunit
MDTPSADVAPPPPGDHDKTALRATGGSPVGRRVFIGMLGLGAVGIVAGSRIENALHSVVAPLQAHDPTGLSDLIPGGDEFQLYTVVDGFPKETDAQWELTVDGMVNTPLNLNYTDLMAMPSTSLVRAFQCVTGWRVPNVHWQGVALSVLLDRAGVKPGATALRFFSFDGTYTESLSLGQARRPDVIAAYSMLGGPVSTEHGGPVRLYVAPMYGYKSLKWLSRITVTNEVVPGYWEQQGYSVDGWVGKSNGRNDPPT